MRLLVTGGCGFIGSAFVRRVLTEAPDRTVVNLDALTYAADPRSVAPVAEAPGYRFVQGDIRDQALVRGLLADHQIDAIVHFAAESHVDRSLEGPQAFLETNITGTFALLQAARAHVANGAKGFRFLHVSTDEVFGDLTLDAAPFDEDSRYEPSSPYSASKAASDHLVRAWGRTYDLPYLITNCSNNYGPYQFPEKLIPHMITRALGGLPLPVYGDGANIRDWLHVEDHVSGILAVLERGHLGETYCIGGRAERKNIDVVRAIAAHMDELAPRADRASYAEQITFVTDRPGHDRRYAITPDKIGRDLGWTPDHTFDEGLRATVAWYLDNRGWWKPHLDKGAA